MFPHTIIKNIEKVVGAENISDADELVRSVTLKKSPAEQKCLKEAARISELGLKAVLEKIRPGMTEIQLCGYCYSSYAGCRRGATGGYPIWCCSGPNSIQAISRPTHARCKPEKSFISALELKLPATVRVSDVRSFWANVLKR